MSKLRVAKEKPSMETYLADGDLPSYISGGWTLCKRGGSYELVHVDDLRGSVGDTLEECEFFVRALRKPKNLGDSYGVEDQEVVSAADLVYLHAILPSYVYVGDELVWVEVSGVREQRTKTTRTTAVVVKLARCSQTVSADKGFYYLALEQMLLANLEQRTLSQVEGHFKGVRL